ERDWGRARDFERGARRGAGAVLGAVDVEVERWADARGTASVRLWLWCGGGDEYTASPPSPSMYTSALVSTSTSPAFPSHTSPRLVRSSSSFRLDSLLRQCRKRPVPHPLNGDARSALLSMSVFAYAAHDAHTGHARAVLLPCSMWSQGGGGVLLCDNDDEERGYDYPQRREAGARGDHSDCAGAYEKERAHAHRGNFTFPRCRCCAGFGFCASPRDAGGEAGEAEKRRFRFRRRRRWNTNARTRGEAVRREREREKGKGKEVEAK
ncbi:hypothetical protein C8R45DRAFT_1185324, partial [Mycena sanguinolenta]